MNKIKIADKEYEMECNALTYLKYKTYFDEGIMQAVGKVQEYLIRQLAADQAATDTKMNEEERLIYIGETMKEYVDDFIITITKLAWIFIKTANKDVPDYETWMESLPPFQISEDWIVKVAEYSVACFYRQEGNGTVR